MIFSPFVFLALLSLTSAHFSIEYPYWRGSSFAEGTSQWIFPCANVTETADPTNRTAWSPTSGSLRLHVGHHWALTYVNIGLGPNATNFNISLVDHFNQTGNGTFCLKETGKSKLVAGLKAAGLEGEAVEGVQATLQVVQISTTGGALYNCADITFNSTAALLADSECANSTDVGGITVVNANEAANTTGTPPSSSTASSTAATSSGAAVGIGVAGGGIGGILVAVLGAGMAVL
ncbi:hypothetical protein K432DRAFT_405085 [Lepidopterella palustris CBS 459.81]|uniref:Copper acquisition factor BIM1-like domain-containing protein n=1 Tax=Lepidopterella palustris CBS 459.81 TaxID=1314670 RepID=A0A8E2EA13_9PEZI|nr:hypothetical protein K432DRAFT_405085 [Lepidopterella palustris CBS 459.81]